MIFDLEFNVLKSKKKVKAREVILILMANRF